MLTDNAFVTKIVRYKCGCEVTSHKWGPWKKASNVCEKHGADIVRITTIAKESKV